MIVLRNLGQQHRHNLIMQLRWRSCWSCGQDAKKLDVGLFCPSCKTLQKPEDSRNYFSIIGVDESFDLDTSDLSKRYKNLQKYLHPDKFANRDKKELEISENYSSLVNEAYNTLLEPLSRGIYMLKLKGKEIPEATEVLDKKFLMEVMELNEEVEEAETNEDILKINEVNKIRVKELTQLVSKAFFSGDLNEVTNLLSKLRYFTSLDNQIQNVIRNKGIIR